MPSPVEVVPRGREIGLIEKRGPLIEACETRNFPLFLDRIGRLELREIVTSDSPWSYWTMEIYRDDIKGQGGLGMLVSDTIEVAKKIGIPMVMVTPFYPVERSHKIENFNQRDVRNRITPQERGFTHIGETNIRTQGYERVPLGIFVKKEGSVAMITVSEPNFGELYQDNNNSDHRLYQEVALGFGGYKALKTLNVTPSMSQQLNEATTVFAALARLDEKVQKIQSLHPDVEPHAVFIKALIEIKGKTIYTNHTLDQAAEAEFTLGQFEYFVMPNIKNEEIKQWLRRKIVGKGGRIKLSTLAIDLAGKKNGVSKAHAKEASRTYKDYDGNAVSFEGVTNGISLERWGDPELLELYRQKGIIDEFGLSGGDLSERLARAEEHRFREIKENAKVDLRNLLRRRADQYGNEVEIPEGAKIFNWRRRLADYKRPGMIFETPDRLADLLETENIHFVLTGNVHPADGLMKEKLKAILEIIDKNPILHKRVHFIQDYDEKLGKYLSRGADVSINTPKVRDHGTGRRIFTEACGTSWMKDILNNVILISTDDGGVADPTMDAQEKGIKNFDPPYLQISGENYKEEVDSMYSQMKKAARIVDNKDDKYSWEKFVKKQLEGYIPIISGARMEANYLDLGFPLRAPS